jgi:ABC-type antimicrobial peptide transport system permease subunit
VALGASATQVGRLVAWQGLLPIAAGLFVGLGLGLALGRLMRSILFQVSPTDPVTLLGVTGVLAAVAIASTIGPALRAARVDPLSALRSE